ncbi:MAG: response regulator, partial [Chloroflexi bacterium]|nr:response regulator [Chloroflexota bacterium]
VGPEIEDDAQPPGRRRQSPGPGEHLLVVDDEPDIRDLLVRVLEQERYTVDLAEEGGEAWDMLMARSYDCIVLDLKMPGVGGRELYQRIKESDYRLAKKVIFITGDTISNNTQDFIISTGNTAVSKPLDMDVLLMQVRKCLDATRNAR